MTLDEDKLVDAGAERHVVAGICKYGWDAFCDVDDILNSGSFTSDSLQIIYKALKQIFEKDQNAQIDAPVIMAEAQSMGHDGFFDRPDESKFLRAVLKSHVELSNVRKLAGKVRKLQIARLLHDQLAQSQLTLQSITGEETLGHILGLVENPIFDFTTLLGSTDDKKPIPLGNDIENFIEFLAENPVEQIGISTGYPEFDRAIGGGLRRGTVTIVGARPKIGKTQWADNVGLNVSQRKIPTLNLDTEMTENDHKFRCLANLSDVEVNEIENGQFGKESGKLDRVRKAGQTLKEIPYDHIKIGGMPFEDVLSLMRRWLMQRVGYDENGKLNDCVVIYDYLKLTSSDALENLQEFQALGFQMTSLHNFGVKYDIPILAFIQLNRDGITKESTDAASGSDRIIWLCSNFSIWKKKTEEEIANDGPQHGNRKLVPIIARHGAEWDDGDYINYQLDGKFARITELSTRSQLHRQKKIEDSGFEIEGESANHDYSPALTEF